MIIVIDHQATWDYWRENLCPYDLEEYGRDDDDILWYDRWMNWIVGCTCFDDSNDQEYYYPFSIRATARLQAMGIRYEVRPDD